MDGNCLKHRLTEGERLEFEKNGFLVVEDVLPQQMIGNLLPVVDQLDNQYRADQGLGPHERVNMLDFIGKDDLFLELLDWPLTFPKVWDILGWNIQLYHTHMVVTPPVDSKSLKAGKRMGWHQDSGRLNDDLETNPRPRISIKVAFFLTDTTQSNSGNFYVMPGSHLQNNPPFFGSNSDLDSRNIFSEVGDDIPKGAVPLMVSPGTAVFFDRRIWHSASPNLSDITRKVLFYGYSYRWLRPRDNMTVDHYLGRCNPLRQQLLGVSPNGGMGYTSPQDEDVPLKTWLIEQLGEEAAVV